MTTRPPRLTVAGARAPRRALDALDALASVTSPLRDAGVGLAGLVGEPLAALTARADAPRLLERALARIETPASAEAADGGTRRRAASALPPWSARPEASAAPASATVDAAMPTRRAVGEVAAAAAASPAAVKAAIERALVTHAPRDATRSAKAPAVTTTTSPARPAETKSLTRRRAAPVAPKEVAPKDAAAIDRADAPPGLSAFSARIAGGAQAARARLVPARRDAATSGASARGDARTRGDAPASGPRSDRAPASSTSAPSSAAMAPLAPPTATAPTAPTAPTARSATPAPIATTRASQPGAPPAPAPRGLAGLVAQWNRGADAAPPTDATSAAAPPTAAAILERRIATAAPAIGAGTGAPPVGELVALDQLTHAIERVLVAEVRRHGLVVEDS